MPSPNYAVKIQRLYYSDNRRRTLDYEEILPGANQSIFAFKTKENAIDYAKGIIADNIAFELHLHKSLLLKYLDINTKDTDDPSIVAGFCTADKPDTICVELTIKLLEVIPCKNPYNE